MAEHEESLERTKLLVRRAMDDYVEKRIADYSRRNLLKELLGKDHLIFALKGARSANDWVLEALTAYEASAEETVMGNSWQQILDDLSHSGGATDLLVENEHLLWVVEMKSHAKALNAASLGQTVRSLQRKVLAQRRPRTPSRRGVFAMIGVIQGTAHDSYPRYRTPSPEDTDIDGFQYRYMVGAPFRAWLAGLSDPTDLTNDWRKWARRTRRERDVCRARLSGELVQMLSERHLPLDITSILTLSVEAHL